MKRRLVIIAILAVAVCGAGALGYHFWDQSRRFVTTDDALVDVDLVAVASPIAGALNTWAVEEGKRVQKGQLLGDVLPVQAGLPNVPITAPITGTIVKSSAVVGQAVAPGVPLAYVAALDRVYVTAYVDETDLARLQPGAPADVSIDAFGDSRFRGVVERVGLATASTFSLLPSTHGTGNYTKVQQRIPVRIQLLDTNGHRVLPGMNAVVRVRVQG